MVTARAQTAWGAGALVATLAAAVFLVAIAPRLELGRSYAVHVLFTELGGLREGAPVRSAGAEIGHVRSISLVPRGSRGAADAVGGDATVAVELALSRRQRHRTWRLGTAVVSSRGVLSARYLELLPPRGEPGPPLADGDVLRGVDPPVLDRALARAWTNLRLSRQLAEEVAPLARQLVAEARALDENVRALSGSAPAFPAFPSVAALAAEAERAWHEVLAEGAVATGGRRAVARAQRLVHSVEDSVRGLQGEVDLAQATAEAALAQLATRAPADKLAAAVVAVRSLSPKLERLRSDLGALWTRWQRKEGTVGRLLSDPEFPEDAKELGKIIKRQPWRLFGRPKEEVERAR